MRENGDNTRIISSIGGNQSQPEAVSEHDTQGAAADVTQGAAADVTQGAAADVTHGAAADVTHGDAECFSPRQSSAALNKIIAILKDPITRRLIQDPVVAADAYAYDRPAIEEWLNTMRSRATSPMTGQILINRRLRQCWQLKQIVELLTEWHPELVSNQQSQEDMQIAAQLHMEELKKRIAKREHQNQTIHRQVLALQDELGSSAENLQNQLTIYAQKLTESEQKLAEKEMQLRELQHIIDKIRSSASDQSSFISLPVEGNCHERDFSEHHNLHPETVLNTLIDNPKLKLLKSGLYKMSAMLHAHPLWIDKILTLKDNTILTASQEPIIRRWDPYTWTEKNQYRGHAVSNMLFQHQRAGQIYDLALSPNQKYFASASADGLVIIWDLESNSIVTRLQGFHNQGSDICCVCYIDDNTIATGGRDCNIIIWDIGLAQPKSTLTGHEKHIYGLVYLSENNELVSCGGDEGKSEVKVWNLSTNTLVCNLEEHSSLTYDIIKTPHESYVITASDDKTICIWDTKTWKLDKQLIGHTDFVNTLTMLDQTTLVSGSEDSSIKLWNIITGVCLATYKVNGKIWGITTLANNTIICGDITGTLYVYKKYSYDLGFRDKLSQCCVVEYKDNQSEVVIARNIGDAVTDEEWFEHTRECIEFIRDILREEVSIRYATTKIEIVLNNSRSATTVHTLLLACLKQQHSKLMLHEKMPVTSVAQSQHTSIFGSNLQSGDGAGREENTTLQLRGGV